MLSVSPGASILGTAFNDLTGNGMTADDTHLQNITINLFRDGGNGTFQGTALGTDDTPVGTQQTDSSGKYRFDNLTAGTYFVQEIPPAGYVLPPASSPVTTVIVTSAAGGGARPEEHEPRRWWLALRLHQPDLAPPRLHRHAGPL